LLILVICFHPLSPWHKPQLASSKADMAVQLLTQAEGYGIIVGLSVLFCLIIVAAVQIQKRYLSEDSDESEMFMVANRSVGTGLTASAVFSSWSVHYFPSVNQSL
jgi:hypothetical protein